MTSDDFLHACLVVTLLILCIALAAIVVRLVRGPSLPDRILSVDLLVSVAIGLIAAFGIRTEFFIYVDIAIALGLVGFLSTVALARFVLRRGELSDSVADAPSHD